MTLDEFLKHLIFTFPWAIVKGTADDWRLVLLREIFKVYPFSFGLFVGGVVFQGIDSIKQLLFAEVKWWQFKSLFLLILRILRVL